MVSGEAGKGDETSWDVGLNPELAAGLARSPHLFREGTARCKGWSGERLETGRFIIII